MGTYKYDLASNLDTLRLKHNLSLISDVVNTPEFRQYIADKCLDEVNDITEYTVIGDIEHSVFEAKVEEYKRNHRSKIRGSVITIYNDTAYTQDELFWVSPKTGTTIQNYPDGISIAKIIEYGTGIRGTSQPDWKTNIGSHNSTGAGHIAKIGSRKGEYVNNTIWRYYNPDTGELVRTDGREGYFIYQKLMERVEEKFGSWLDEYIERGLK